MPGSMNSGPRLRFATVTVFCVMISLRPGPNAPAAWPDAAAPAVAAPAPVTAATMATLRTVASQGARLPWNPIDPLFRTAPSALAGGPCPLGTLVRGRPEPAANQPARATATED